MNNLELKKQWVKKYHSFGWSLIPVTKDKISAVKWSKSQKEKAPLFELLNWVEEGFGIAVVTGKISNLTVIDDDNPKLEKKDQYIIPQLDSTIISKTQNGGRHYFFADYGDNNKQQIKDDDKFIHIELRANGGIALLPPFFDYEWIREPTKQKIDLLPGKEAIPKKLLDLFSAKKNNTTSFKDLISDSLGASEYRNPMLFEISRRMWMNHFRGYKGYSFAHIKEFLYITNSQFNPPKTQEVVDKVIEQGYEYAKRFAIEEGLIEDSQDEQDLTLGSLIKDQLDRKKKATFKSGYKEIDDATGGFEYSNLYVIAGLEKSGKTSLLMKMLQDKIQEGERIGYVNTEVPAIEFATRMACYWTNKRFEKLTDEDIQGWTTKYSDKFDYLGVESLPKLKNLKPRLQRMVDGGIKCLVFDNITSWGMSSDPDQDGWKLTSSLMNNLLEVTKKNDIVTFCVMHIKQDTVYAAKNMKGILKQIEENDFDRIFSRNQTIVTRPNLANVYGGGAMLSQISGALLIWRPWQKIDSNIAQQKTRIILESFRQAPTADLEYYFLGERGLFTDDPSIAFSDNE